MSKNETRIVPVMVINEDIFGDINYSNPCQISVYKEKDLPAIYCLYKIGHDNNSIDILCVKIIEDASAFIEEVTNLSKYLSAEIVVDVWFIDEHKNNLR